jgi:hypothetical protein
MWASVAPGVTVCSTMLTRRKGKYGAILITDIAGLLLIRFILGDKPISAEILDVHTF